jgi:hypothetical protein
MPHGTKTVSKIHLFADLPQPFTTRRAGTLPVSCGSHRPAATQGRGPTRAIAATPNQSRRDRLPWWQPLVTCPGPEPVDVRTSAMSARKPMPCTVASRRVAG